MHSVLIGSIAPDTPDGVGGVQDGPAIIKMIQQVVDAARSANIGVSLCGEMAGDPLCVSILLGLGINDISMNARLVPLIRTVIRSISMKEAKADLKLILKLNTAEEVRAYVVERMKSLVPELESEGYLEPK